jgi:two-component system chemotaxis response regulator CheB
MLSAQADLEVVGAAQDPYDARDKIKALLPDVMTLDVEMPKMDGLSFLEKVMALHPMPVIMVSTLTGKGTDTAIEALQLGAVDCLAKPTATSDSELALFSASLSAMIRMAAKANIRPRRQAAAIRQGAEFKLGKGAPKIIAIGASTGGVEALTEVLTHLPKEMPPIVITQHMPAVFTTSFAKRLSTICNLRVEEAEDRMPLRSGMAVIAPGGKHMEIARAGSEFYSKVSDGLPVSGHKPSVDVLFNSVAKEAASLALGIILTGMGRDGAKGLLEMRNAGAHTIGQDEASCIVYGMPRVAHELGAVTDVISLNMIADAIKERCAL